MRSRQSKTLVRTRFVWAS